MNDVQDWTQPNNVRQQLEYIALSLKDWRLDRIAVRRAMCVFPNSPATYQRTMDSRKLLGTWTLAGIVTNQRNA